MMKTVVVPQIPDAASFANPAGIPEPLTDAQFSRLASFIQQNVGIRMPAAKKLMVQSRLTARLKALGYTTYAEYINYVFSSTPDAQEEMISMIDVITTNLTHFFRENQHFNFMTSTVLPELQQMHISTPLIWSAGCSTGEEPYTLSIVMQEYLRTHPAAFSSYKILASDISTRVLDKAQNGVYPADTVEELSYDLKKRYFLKSRDPQKALVRVNQQTRSAVSFRRINFMDDTFRGIDRMHIIFCRNVLIYFEKPIQLSVIQKLVDHLVPGGYLFLGHSETIFGMDLPLKNVAPTVFRKLPVNGA